MAVCIQLMKKKEAAICPSVYQSIETMSQRTSRAELENECKAAGSLPNHALRTKWTAAKAIRFSYRITDNVVGPVELMVGQVLVLV